MQINDEALPVVLSLLDQLYEARWRMRCVADALDRAVPERREALAQEVRRLLMSNPP